jgi:DNA-binding NarL/FixJ family response regulator
MQDRSSTPAHAASEPDDDQSALRIVVIDKRMLLREALSGCIAGAFAVPVASYASVDDWKNANAPEAVVILSVRDWGLHEIQEARRIVAEPQARLVILSDMESHAIAWDALKNGARGYLTLEQPLNLAFEGLRLVLAGGTIAPRAIGVSAPCANRSDVSEATFTTRELEVLDALCMGRSNKIIGHDLNMCENTVKVHVRNIMRKLNAKNRTEVAYLARRMRSR